MLPSLPYTELNTVTLPAYGKMTRVSERECPNVSSISVIWCTDSGISYYHKIHNAPGYSSMTPDFVCTQTNEIIHNANLQVKLSQTPGHYYSVQLGGSSNSWLLMKIPFNISREDIDEMNLRWNAVNFLHRIGWIEYPGGTSANQHMLGIPLTLQTCLIPWVSNDQRKALIEAIPGIDIHWVWFRRVGYKVKQEIIERACSWIALNPECRFHLWTDIPTLADFDDFMSLVDLEWRDPFVQRVNVHLQESTNQLIDEAFQHIRLIRPETETGLKLLRAEFESTQKQSRIYKTDFVRLFILGMRGGIYVDFNDCLCLAPIRDMIALYGYDTPLGVCDFYDANHASNYFLYCPPLIAENSNDSGNLNWNLIVADMVEHFPHVVTAIRNMDLCASVRGYVQRAIKSLSSEAHEILDITELATLFGRHELPHCGNERLTKDMWNRFIWVLVGAIASVVSDTDIRQKIQPRMEYSKNPQRSRGRNRPPFAIIDASTIDAMLEYITNDQVYEELFLFWWTDYNLRTLMHYTNLPIFCRMRKTRLVMLPFGYLFIYCCALSWVGHIGDGTSYGMDGRKDGIRVRNLLKSNDDNPTSATAPTKIKYI